MGDTHSSEEFPTEFSTEEPIENSPSQKCNCTMEITSCEWCIETESNLKGTITSVIDSKDNHIQRDLNIQATIKKNSGVSRLDNSGRIMSSGEFHPDLEKNPAI
jgi:hypothetical protein